MPKSSYQPQWPETTLFWGAGATAVLGLPTTAAMGQAIYDLARPQENISLLERIENIKVFKGIEIELSHFLRFLGDDMSSYYAQMNDAEIEAFQQLFPDIEEDRLNRTVYWRTLYDWDALRGLAQKVPIENDDGATYLQDLYNVIDGSILNNRAVTALYQEKFGVRVLEPRRLVGARTLLNLLLQWMLSCGYWQALKEPEKLQPYIQFAQHLSSLMRTEGMYLAGLQSSKADNEFFSQRQFYLFSYAVISMNFDPILLWLIFNAHRDDNDNPSHLGSLNKPMKLYHDFAHFLGVRKVEGKTPEVWYPFNESVAQRINGGHGDRIGRIGKYYFPHGSTNFRECVECGKLTVALGKEWTFLSPSLFLHPPFPVKSLDIEPDCRSMEEINGLEENSSVVQCSFCGHLTHCEDTPMVMQTSFKSQHSSFIEEIQRDLKVCLSKTKHVVLMGYSLPKDDVTWRSVLVSKQSEEKTVFCSVVVGYKGKKQWMVGEELDHYVQDIIKQNPPDDWPNWGIPAIEAARAIFGKDQVRAYTGGIPNVWAGGKNAVQDLLYPVQFFKAGFPELLKERF